MRSSVPESIRDLIEEFNKLPGIGPKTAGRLTFYLLNRPKEEIKKLAEVISNLKENLTICKECFNIAEDNPCLICTDETRDKDKICIVEEPLDVLALERSGYKGLYHVLGGVISPINGIGPDNLRIKELFDRIKRGDARELILATDPSLEGEATAMYISNKVADIKEKREKSKNIKVTRIARGLPVGGDLEYADEITLAKALEGRREY